jgi:hypothetical protein
LVKHLAWLGMHGQPIARPGGRAARRRIRESLSARAAAPARIEKYGPESEKLSDEQPALLELEPGVSQAEVQAESERAQLKLPLRKGRQPIGYETSEQLDVEPAKHFVLVTKREKARLPRCQEQGVETAALPARIIPKAWSVTGSSSTRSSTNTVDHLPLFRQSAMLERETGLELSRVTLCG